MAMRILDVGGLFRDHADRSVGFDERVPQAGYDLVLVDVEKFAAIDDPAWRWRIADLGKGVSEGPPLAVVFFGYSPYFESNRRGAFGTTRDMHLATVGNAFGLDFEWTEIESDFVAHSTGCAILTSPGLSWHTNCYFSNPEEDCQPDTLLIAGIGKMPVGQAHCFENGSSVILLPTLTIDESASSQTLNHVIEFLGLFSENFDGEQAPPWAADVIVPGEQPKLDAVNAASQKAAEAERDRSKAVVELTVVQEWKQLVWATGAQFEDIVTEAFKLLGFKMLPTQRGFADHSMDYGESQIVAEVKGKNGGATKTDARQLDEWVENAREIIEEALLVGGSSRAVHGIFVVNGFRGISPAERSGTVFTKQVLDYCEKRGFCCITGVQLFAMVCNVIEDNAPRETYASLLISTIGQLSGI